MYKSKSFLTENIEETKDVERRKGFINRKKVVVSKKIKRYETYGELTKRVLDWINDNNINVISYTTSPYYIKPEFREGDYRYSYSYWHKTEVVVVTVIYKDTL